jgi:predicted DNA-binding transcriptional regulator YafY
VTRGVWSAPACRARIKLLVAADAVAERLPPYIGLLEPIDEHSCYFDTGASTFEGLAMHLALLGVDFEVTEPAELVEQVRRLIDRYWRAIG